MAFVREEDQKTPFARLTAMTQPEATPTKRVGTEAPVGAVTAGPAAGKAPGEFTQTTRTSPGSVFKRQLEGADISGISKLAEQPLYREAGQESARIAREGIGYKEQAAKTLAEQPQFKFKEGDKDLTSDIIKRIGAGGEEFEKAKGILSRTESDIPISQFTSAPVREYSPMQAMKGGTIETVLRRESQAPMTTGMAGLDALLFKGQGGAQALERTGTGIRTAQQVALDILQGKQGNTLTDAMKAALTAVGLKVPAGGLTEEARKDAIDFINKQKEQLTTGLKGGVTATEEAYTKAPEGGVSKLTQAQRDLYNQQQQAFRGAQQQFKEALQKRVQDVETGLLDQFYRANFAPEGGAIWESGGMMTPMQRAQIEADPNYQAMLAKFRESVATPFLQQNDLTAIDLDAIPQLGMQNIITPEDEASYNRLLTLLGRPTIQRQAVAAPKATIDYSSSNKFLDELMNRANLQSMMKSQPLTQGMNIPLPQNYGSFNPIYIGMGG